jgi:hypothetical protein
MQYEEDDDDVVPVEITNQMLSRILIFGCPPSPWALTVPAWWLKVRSLRGTLTMLVILLRCKGFSLGCKYPLHGTACLAACRRRRHLSRTGSAYI